MKENNQSRHKNIRIKNYDYSQSGYYFVTLCTYDRKNILCKILDSPHQSQNLSDCVLLTDAGNTVDKYIKNINLVYSNIE